MRDLLFRQPLTVALALVAIVLAVAIGFEVWNGRGNTGFASVAGTKAASVDAKLLPGLTEAPAEQVYPETGARPLFTPTRRPAPAAVAASAMTKGQYVLQGVTIVGDVRVALLRDKTAGRIYRIQKGGDLNGSTVAAIEPERVTLKQGDDQEVLELSVQKGGNAAAATQQGPFSAPAAGSAASPPAPQGSPASPGQPVPGMPAATGQPPMMPARPGTGPMPGTPQPPAANPTTAAPAAGQAVTPEELLARRRAARRTQQAQ